MNPDGEHLVCGLLSLPTIYAFSAAVWAILLVKNALRALAMGWKRVTLLQMLFVATAAVKVAFASLASAKWSQISRTGVYTYDTLTLSAAVTGALFYFLFFGTLFMLSSGWAVTRKNFVTDKIAFVISK